MSDATMREELNAQARRLVDHSIVQARHVVVNPNNGTVRDIWSGALLHYESGLTAKWAPWRQPVWVRT